MKNVFLIIISVLIGGCATSSGFDRGALRSDLNSGVVVSEKSIKKALELKPQLPEAFKLAIYFVPQKKPEYYSGVDKFVWTLKDKELIKSAANQLKAKGDISEVVLISDSIVEGDSNEAIRLAAARTGADAVIIVNGVGDIDRYNNPLAATYLLLVTAAFVPGTEIDALAMLSASMWDVRNKYLYMSAEAEHIHEITRPAMFANEEQAIKKAKESALVALKEELEFHLNNMSR